MIKSISLRRIFSFLTALSLIVCCTVTASSLETASADSFYATAVVTDDEIRVEFSKLPNEVKASELCVINTETGEEILIDDPYFLSKTMIVPLNEQPEATVEYCLILPENMQSLNGIEISDRYIYFVTPMDRDDTQHVVIVNDTFDDYVTDGKLPPNWYGRTQGSFNDFNIYSDEEHDKAFKSSMNGLVQIFNTRNFGKTIDYKFKIEFDYKQTEMNKYIKGEEDPNLVQAVYDSIKSKYAGLNSIDQINQNMRMFLAPVAENGKIRTDSKGNDLNAAGFQSTADKSYVSNDKIVYPEAFFQVYGDRMGFGNGILPNEGDYVKIEKNKWYHIELDIDMEKLEVTAYIDGEKIGPHSLPSGYKDTQYGAVAARASFMVENPVKMEMADEVITYTDSETGEEKTFSRKNDAHFAIDNFKVINEEPAFKPLKARFVSVEGEELAPMREINSIINKLTINFTSGVDINSINDANITVTDEDGSIYSFEVTDYNEDTFTVELTFDKFLTPDKIYNVSINGVYSNLGAPAESYQICFILGKSKGYYIGDIKVLDGYQNYITDLLIKVKN